MVIRWSLRLMAGLIVASCVLAAPSFGQRIRDNFYKWDTIKTPKGEGKPHGSSMVELENGDILATWYAATEETDSQAQIFGAVWRRAKWAWDEPYVVIPRSYSKSVGNTALYLDEEGIIWLFFSAVRVGGWSGSNIDYAQSRDGGKTWSPGKTLVGSLGHLPRNRPIPLGPGKMLAPFFIDFWYEADMVGSYTMLIEYKNGEILSSSVTHLDDYDAIQPTLVKLPSGRILLLARDKSNKFIRRSYSSDEGKSWAPMSMTSLPNPGAAVSAIFVEELKCVLLAYNHSRTAANPLSLAFSLDEGMTFHRLPNLAGDRLWNLSAYSYPTLLKTKEGFIHVIWTHNNREALKHSVFDLRWLKLKMDASLAEESQQKTSLPQAPR